MSSAITKRPASRAFTIASSTAGPFGVIRMPASPLEMAFSMAWIWVSSSPSSLPAASVSSTPRSSAAASAPSCMATKNGLVVVLTISETPIGVVAGGLGGAAGAAQAHPVKASAAAAASDPAAMRRRRSAPGAA